jgi:hypothetical protein
MSDQLHALAVSYPRKKPQYQPRRRLGGPLSGSGHCGEETSLFPLLGIESRFLSHPAHNPVAVPCRVPPPDKSAPDYTTVILICSCFKQRYTEFLRGNLYQNGYIKSREGTGRIQ